MTTGLWVTDSDDGGEELVLLPVTDDSENFQWYLTDALYNGWYIGRVSALKVDEANIVDIVAIAGRHGDISPEGIVSLPKGASQTLLDAVILNVIPGQGSMLVQWETGDGSTVEGIIYVNGDVVVTAVIGHCGG